MVAAQKSNLLPFLLVGSSSKSKRYTILFYSFNSPFFASKHVQSLTMAESNDVFRMLVVEDKLNGKKYPLWAYMMCHVLVAKGLWNVVQRVEKRPVVENTNVDGIDFVKDVDHPSHAHVAVFVVPNAE